MHRVSLSPRGSSKDVPFSSPQLQFPHTLRVSAVCLLHTTSRIGNFQRSGVIRGVERSTPALTSYPYGILCGCWELYSETTDVEVGAIVGHEAAHSNSREYASPRLTGRPRLKHRQCRTSELLKHRELSDASGLVEAGDGAISTRAKTTSMLSHVFASFVSGILRLLDVPCFSGDSSFDFLERHRVQLTREPDHHVAHIWLVITLPGPD